MNEMDAMNRGATTAWKRWSRFGIVAMLTLLAAGCATGPRLLHTEVTTYDEWATLPSDRTYTFGRTLEFQNSLEVKSYEDIVRDELALQGFRPAADPASANLVVTLRPSVTTTRVRVDNGWAGDPFWGGFGGPYGFYGRRGWYGPGWYDPFWSYGGFNAYPVDVYLRRLELDIDARGVPGRRYYEGRAESAGDNPSMKNVMPALVRALFSEFPGNNGQTRRVDVPIERK